MGAGAVILGGGYYFVGSGSSQAVPKPQILKEVKASGNEAFKGGNQGFIDLKLTKVETVNHNTKKFRFALPEEGDVSGLKIACKHYYGRCRGWPLMIVQLRFLQNFKDPMMRNQR